MAWHRKGGFVYGLRNPIDNSFFYVGQTINKLNERLRQHISESKFRDFERCEVIRKIMSKNLFPEIIELENIENEDYSEVEKALSFQERVWVNKLIQQNEPLTNQLLKNYMAQKVCENCGKVFEQNHGKQKFCSTNCRVKHSYKDQTVEAGKQSATPIISKEIPKTKLVVTEKAVLKEKPSNEINAKVQEAIDKINKDFGPNTIFRLGDAPMTIETISTGSLGLDRALGIGGLPRGRIVEIYGPESSGKTTITLHVMAQAQKMGLMVAMIDAENSFDAEYAESIGVNLENMYLCQPSHGEQALEVADRAITSGGYGVVIIDSVAALVPKAELEGQMGDSKMGLHARLMSQACRKLTSTVSKTNTLCIFINQLRSQIGVIYGNPEITTGGNALKFFSSVRLDVRRMTQIKDGEVSLGNRTKVKVVKNKCASPFKVAEFDIIYGKGISKIGEVVDMGVMEGIIVKSGSWYSYSNAKLGQGRDAAITMLEDNPELYLEIEKKLTK